MSSARIVYKVSHLPSVPVTVNTHTVAYELWVGCMCGCHCCLSYCYVGFRFFLLLRMGEAVAELLQIRYHKWRLPHGYWGCKHNHDVAARAVTSQDCSRFVIVVVTSILLLAHTHFF